MAKQSIATFGSLFSMAAMVALLSGCPGGGSNSGAGTGGVGLGGTTGMVATGGSSGGTGTLVGTADSGASDGDSATGGTTGTGGGSSTGGVTSTGGIVSTGGIASTGGIVSTGGIASTGGVKGVGGTAGTGGTTDTGVALDGGASTGGSIGTGGREAFGSGGSTGTGGVDGGNINADGPQACNNVALVGAQIGKTSHPGPAPTMTGGTIVAGTYILTAMDKYNDTVGSSTHRETWVLTATSASVVVEDSINTPTIQRYSGTYTTSGNILTLNITCPVTATQPVEFTVTGNKLAILSEPQSSDQEVHVFTLQP